MNSKVPFEQALAATPAFPQDAAQTAFKKIRRRIIIKNIAGLSGTFGLVAVLLMVFVSTYLPAPSPAPSAEVVQELQYVHDCVIGTDSETDVQYASAY